MKFKILLSIFCFVLGFNAYSQDFDSKISSEAIKKLERIILLAPSNSTGTDRILKMVNFPPHQFLDHGEWKNYKQWPVLRKYEAAYITAEEAAPNSGGNAFLRKTTRLIAAHQNDAIRYDRAVSEFFEEGLKARIMETQGFESGYKIPKQSLTSFNPPESVRKIVAVMARHTNSMPGGMTRFMSRCCGIKSGKAYDMQRKMSSISELIESAILNSSVPPALKEKLTRAAHFLESYNESLSFTLIKKTANVKNTKNQSFVDQVVKTIDSDANFEAFEKEVASLLEEADNSNQNQKPEASLLKTREDVSFIPESLINKEPGIGLDGGATTNETVNVPSGGGGGGSSDNTQKYRNFTNENYSSRSRKGGNNHSGGAGVGSGGVSRQFRAMTRFRGGFGGIIFGETVLAASSLPKPSSFRWIQDLQGETRNTELENWGRFQFTFADGSSGFTRRIREDNAWAAIELAKVVPEGEGIGLTSATNNRSIYYDVKNSKIRRIASGTEFIVHPILEGLKLGNAVIAVDGFPFIAKSFLIKASEKYGVSPSKRTLLKKWLYKHKGNYKFIDVSLLVDRESSGLIRAYRLRKTSPNHTFSHRKKAFLTLQGFDDHGDPITPGSLSTYDLIPVLTKISPDFSRVNDFAQVFGIVRWARLSDATFIGKIQRPPVNALQPSFLYDEKANQIYRGPSANKMQLAFIEERGVESNKIVKYHQLNQELLNVGKGLTSKRKRLLAIKSAIHNLGSTTSIIRNALPESNPKRIKYEEALIAQTEAKNYTSRIEARNNLQRVTDSVSVIVPAFGIRERLSDQLASVDSEIFELDLSKYFLKSKTALRDSEDYVEGVNLWCDLQYDVRACGQWVRSRLLEESADESEVHVDN